MTYNTIIIAITGAVGTLGYIGIFILMFLESTFFPFPSEVVLIPAGYLIYKGELDFTLVILMSILGSVAGAWLNYYIAYKFGRKFLLKFIKKSKLDKVESFFAKHGPISTFNGRLIPIVRQYISFPAGLAKMDPLTFTIYTILGSLVWGLILIALGYFLGRNLALVHSYLKNITLILITAVIVVTMLYVAYNSYKCRENK